MKPRSLLIPHFVQIMKRSLSNLLASSLINATFNWAPLRVILLLLAPPYYGVGVNVRYRRYKDHKGEEEARSTLKQEIEQEDDLLALESRNNCEVESIR